MALKFVPVRENTTVDFYNSHAAVFNSYNYLCAKKEQEREKYKTFLYNGNGLPNRVLSKELNIKKNTSGHIKNTCQCQYWDIIALEHPLPISCNKPGDTYLVLIFSDKKDTNTLTNWFKSVKDLIWK